jgi:hypothetical protein
MHSVDTMELDVLKGTPASSNEQNFLIKFLPISMAMNHLKTSLLLRSTM